LGKDQAEIITLWPVFLTQQPNHNIQPEKNTMSYLMTFCSKIVLTCKRRSPMLHQTKGYFLLKIEPIEDPIKTTERRKYEK
jgi:hypothetical protein